MNIKPDCTGCGGACCRQLPEHELTKDMRMDNGQCKHLNFWGLCNIYELRPNICRVDWMWEHVYSKQMTVEQYVSLRDEACEMLRQKCKTSL